MEKTKQIEGVRFVWDYNNPKLKNNEIITSFMKQEQQITAYYMYLSDENINDSFREGLSS